MSTTISSNSSTSPLSAAASFTGSTAATGDYESISISVKADQPGTLYVEQGAGTHWDHQSAYTISSARTPNLSFSTRVLLTASHFRVRYVNDSTAQTLFRLQTVAHRHVEGPPNQYGGTAGRSYDLDEAGAQIYSAPARLHSIAASNSAGAAAYLKLFNVAFGDLNVGVTVPLATIMLPAGATVVWQPPHGMQFSTAICWAATLLGTDADATAPGALVIANCTYTAV